MSTVFLPSCIPTPLDTLLCTLPGMVCCTVTFLPPTHQYINLSSPSSFVSGLSNCGCPTRETYDSPPVVSETAMTGSKVIWKEVSD